MLHDNKKGLHIHQSTSINDELLKQYDFYILGGVLCPLCRADKNEKHITRACEYIRGLQPHKKIYIQQPYYLLDNSEQFLNLINQLRSSRLIDGAIINSPGILKYLKQDGLEIVFSRFTIRKRKRTNQYLHDMIKGHNVKAFECFAKDKDLVKDIKSFEGIDLWLREEPETFYAFSANCLTQRYLEGCTGNPEECISGTYMLKNAKQNINFTLSGHFMFAKDMPKVQEDSGDFSSIIYNASGFEL